MNDLAPVLENWGRMERAGLAEAGAPMLKPARWQKDYLAANQFTDDDPDPPDAELHLRAAQAMQRLRKHSNKHYVYLLYRYRDNKPITRGALKEAHSKFRLFW